MIEYIILAAAVGLFLMCLVGVTGAIALKKKGSKLPGTGAGPSLLQPPVQNPPTMVNASSDPLTGIARQLIEAIAEIQKSAAATEIVRAMSDPVNNPHIPSFLSPKSETSVTPSPKV